MKRSALENLVVGFAFYPCIVLAVVKFDPDCVTEVKPQIKNYTSAQMAILIDASTSMTEYREKFQQHVEEILITFKNNYILNNIIGQFSVTLGLFYNGCIQLLKTKESTFTWILPDTVETVKKLLVENNNYTHNNSYGNIENGLFSLFNCQTLIKNSWDKRPLYTRSCKERGRHCVHYYYVLLTGSGYVEKRKNCLGEPSPPLRWFGPGSFFPREMPPYHYGLIGIFPTQTLVEEYKELSSSAIHFKYYGYSLDENPNNVRKIPDFLLDAVSRDTKGTFSAKKPCIWKYPQGYNTLGL